MVGCFKVLMCSHVIGSATMLLQEARDAEFADTINQLYSTYCGPRPDTIG